MSGVRFFKMSFADLNRQSVTLSIDNQENNIEALVNRDPLWIWESSGSDDSDTITFTVEFDKTREIDCLFLLGNNLKNFSLERRNSVGTWIEILSETGNTETDYFAEFTPVSAGAVRLIMNTTMTVDAEKSLREFVVTKSIGQLEGYPKLKFSVSGAADNKEMFGGKQKFIVNEIFHELTLDFNDHVGDSDRELFQILVTLQEAFLVWPCGGDVDQFAYPDIGYRLGDLYLMGIVRGVSHDFTKNLYFSGFNSTIRLSEAA